jgi:transposase
VGFEDETWWSRFAQPSLRSWSEPDESLRLVEQVKQADDADPKALACYGLLVRWMTEGCAAQEQAWLRFVAGRPVSAITTQFLDWCCTKLHSLDIQVLALIWDNASWHVSRAVRKWVKDHNRQVKRTGKGVRILVCALPVKSPWLNPIEPKWVHGKRRIVEPNRTLSADELAERVCAAFDCTHEEHLTIPENVF